MTFWDYLAIYGVLSVGASALLVCWRVIAILLPTLGEGDGNHIGKSE